MDRSHRHIGGINSQWDTERILVVKTGAQGVPSSDKDARRFSRGPTMLVSCRSCSSDDRLFLIQRGSDTGKLIEDEITFTFSKSITLHNGWGPRMGIATPDFGSTPWRDEETLREMYWDKEMSQSDIADEFDTTTETVRRWMDKSEID